MSNESLIDFFYFVDKEGKTFRVGPDLKPVLVKTPKRAASRKETTVRFKL